MKHKMIHYKGYFLLALAFISAAAIMGTSEQVPPFPFLAASFIFLVMGCAKVALRNSHLKTNSN